MSCTKCKENPRAKGQRWCKPCKDVYNRRHYETNEVDIKAQRKERRFLDKLDEHVDLVRAISEPKNPTGRVVIWFSCGAASAVAAKLALQEYGDRCVVVYCDVMNTEHPDNERFFKDVEEWLGHPVHRIKSEQFDSVDEVFEVSRYMVGIQGAKCTSEMKKLPRRAFQKHDDVHIFGFTSDELDRIARFSLNNPELNTDWILFRHRITKDECLEHLKSAGIELPLMYLLGYRNNNCLGCVKASSATYWNMTRRDFPEVFERRCRQSRALGVKLVRIEGELTFLDELPEDYLPAEPLENISCGPDCGE